MTRASTEAAQGGPSPASEQDSRAPERDPAPGETRPDDALSLLPLFIFCVPRSGSTLLQRILASHHDIATVTEPHILAPLLYSLKKRGVYAAYRHRDTVRALHDFCRELPNGVSDYYEEVRRFALRLYAKAAKAETKYFLDKTPVYHRIVLEVMRVFPEGRFVFLWRNPLAVVASCMATFNDDHWNLHLYKADYFGGLAKLIEASRQHAARVCAVRYEDLVLRPEEEARRLFEYLGLSSDPGVVSGFQDVQLKGKITDIRGSRQYTEISREPLDKWKRTLGNPLRKAWCRRYLRWLGEDRIAAMGYDLRALLSELDAVPVSAHRVLSDMIRIPSGTLSCALEFQMLRDKLKTLPAWHRVTPHL